MDSEELPKRNTFYQDMISIRVDRDTKERIEELKHKHNVDTSEWIRRIIKKGLEDLKNN